MITLKDRLREECDAPESCFLEQAITFTQKRQEQLLTNSSDYPSSTEDNCDSSDCDQLSPVQPEVKSEASGANVREVVVKSRQMSGCSVSSDDVSIGSTSSSIIHNLELGVFNIEVEDGQQCEKKSEPQTNIEQLHFSFESPVDDGKESPTKSNFLITYQAEDGSHVYLHKINVSMLSKEYLENLPSTVTAEIIEKNCYVMEERLRNRFKNLQHLQDYCPFETVQLRLTEPLVSKEVLDEFRDILEKREKTRKAKAREEMKIEKRNLKLQEEEMSGHMFRTIRSEAGTIGKSTEVDSLTNDPAVMDLHFPEMGGTGHKSGTEKASGSKPASFANMVRVRQQAKNSQVQFAWPSLDSNTSCVSTSEPTWGCGATHMPVNPFSGYGHTSSASNPSETEECEFNAPNFRQAYSQGIDALFAVPTKHKNKKGRKGKN